MIREIIYRERHNNGKFVRGGCRRVTEEEYETRLDESIEQGIGELPFYLRIPARIAFKRIAIYISDIFRE